jgi:MFS family permease
MSAQVQPASGAARQDWRTIRTIGIAHGTSHFFHLLLPPLFPWFAQEFGLSYAELGLLMTIFFVVSGTGQALSGFLVDRVGARPVLFVAVTCFLAASVAAGTAHGYGGLALAALLAGLGNSPFHPCDFTILNKRVSAARLGHAYSVHGITGNIGWAVALVFSTGIATATGQWRWAYFGTALVALAVLLLMLVSRDAIDDRAVNLATAAKARQAEAGAGTFAFLRLPSVWLCFSFFFCTTLALGALQGFAAPALHQMYGLPLTQSTWVVSGYMLLSAAGMIAGGFIVARASRLERTIAASLLAAAVALALVGTQWLPAVGAALLTALAGLGSGVAGPSRDMLIKQAAPPGATGRVYGTVYSGLDIGFAVSPMIFGTLMDRGQPSGVFVGAAIALALGVVTAGVVGAAVAVRRAAQQPA